MSKLIDYYGVKFNKGEYIFREGDAADVLYMIHKGSVEISKDVKNIHEKIQVLREGEFLGEMAVIDSLPRSADAVAMEDCELIKMDKESFDKSIKDNHQFAISVIKSLTERLRETNEVKTVLSVMDRSKKVLMELLSEFLKNGKKDRSGEWVLIKMAPFVEEFQRKYNWDQQMFDEVMQGLLVQGDITKKKNQNGEGLLAYKI